MQIRILKTLKRRLFVILMLAGLALTWLPGMLPAESPAIAYSPPPVHTDGYSWGG
jgi:hypothetical protein